MSLQQRLTYLLTYNSHCQWMSHLSDLPVRVKEAWFPPDGIQICTLFNQFACSCYRSKLLKSQVASDLIRLGMSTLPDCDIFLFILVFPLVQMGHNEEIFLRMSSKVTSPQPGRLLPTPRDHFLFPGSIACFLTSIWISTNCRGSSKWKQTDFAYSECSLLKSRVVVITSECSGVLVSVFVVVLVVKGDILTNNAANREEKISPYVSVDVA